MPKRPDVMVELWSVLRFSGSWSFILAPCPRGESDATGLEAGQLLRPCVLLVPPESALP